MLKKILLVILISCTFAFFLTSLFTQKIRAGTTPPTTTATLSPTTPDGNNDWYTVPVDFTLQATDLESGVASINWRLDSGAWQQVTFSDTLNLAPNPSFETAGATTSGLADWEATVVDPQGTYTQDPSSAPSYPSSSARIDTTAGTWHGINNYGTFAVTTPYQNMSASVWMKTTNVTGSAYFIVYAIAPDGFGGEIIQEVGRSSSISGSTGWTYVSLEFTVNLANANGVYLDIGLEGPGTLYADAVTLNSSSDTATVTFSVGTEGEHTLEYYSVDNIGNIEYSSCAAPLVNCVEFKIDTTPPGNWNSSGVIRPAGENAHTLHIFTNIEDPISGLSTNSNIYQYLTDNEPDYGSYSDLLDCNSTWQSDTDVALKEGVLADEDNTAYFETQLTNFCNANWKFCKVAKFYAEDMAGNVTDKGLCINGPWIKTEGGGTVRSNNIINMLSEADGDNTDGLIEANGNLIEFFTSSNGWEVKGSTIPNDYDYARIWSLTGTKTEITDGDLVITDGIYWIDGDYEIDNAGTPNNYNTSTFDQIVFINGNLTITDNIEVDSDATALFVVNGDVNIDEAVDLVGISIFTDGEIDTAYNADPTKNQKEIDFYGMFIADTFTFQRSLQGIKNQDTPSEFFHFEPKYIIQLRDLFGGSQVRWVKTE